MLQDYSAKDIETKWQNIWADKRFSCRSGLTSKVFLDHTLSLINDGNLHAGHTRTFTIGDVVARYKRMKGLNVLFPMAFHATGTPIVGLSELIANRDPLIWDVYTKLHRIPEDELVKLNTPEKIVDYFRHQAKKAMQSIGYSIDWRREFTTTDLAYTKFIEWQYGILRSQDYVTKGSHPVRWCPHDMNPVEDHDILKGEDATILDFAEQKSIRQEERAYKSDGKLTKDERKDLHQDMNQASRNIHQEKHDAEKRTPPAAAAK